MGGIHRVLESVGQTEAPAKATTTARLRRNGTKQGQRAHLAGQHMGIGLTRNDVKVGIVDANLEGAERARIGGDEAEADERQSNGNRERDPAARAWVLDLVWARAAGW